MTQVSHVTSEHQPCGLTEGGALFSLVEWKPGAAILPAQIASLPENGASIGEDTQERGQGMSTQISPDRASQPHPHLLRYMVP